MPTEVIEEAVATSGAPTVEQLQVKPSSFKPTPKVSASEKKAIAQFLEAYLPAHQAAGYFSRGNIQKRRAEAELRITTATTAKEKIQAGVEWARPDLDPGRCKEAKAKFKTQVREANKQVAGVVASLAYQAARQVDEVAAAAEEKERKEFEAAGLKGVYEPSLVVLGHRRKAADCRRVAEEAAAGSPLWDPIAALASIGVDAYAYA